jgi:integrase/recombinase XerD
MKLGSLLLRGLKKRRSNPVRKSGPRRFVQKGKPLFKVAQAHARELRRVESTEETSQLGENPLTQLERIPSTEEELTPAIVAKEELVPIQPAPEVLPVEARPSRRENRWDETSLAPTDLIHPDDSLRRSIEGFLLDQRSEHTRRAYGKDLKRFMQYLAMRKNTRGPERIDRRVLIGYKDSLLSEGLEHTTVDRHLATLRSFFRWLVDDGIIEKNPAEGVRFMNPKKISKTNGFSDEEVVKILSKPNLHTRTGAQHYAILMVLFYCGLRRSELCELRNSSIGKERGHFVFRLRGKGNRERVIVIIPAVWNALSHFFKITRKNLQKDDPLFSAIRNNRTGETGKPLDPSMIFYVVTKYARLAGVANRVSPHSCRATAISNARDQHVPDRAIQEFAGWAGPDMITRYDKRKTAVEDSAAHAIRYGDRERTLPEWRESAPQTGTSVDTSLAES